MLDGAGSLIFVKDTGASKSDFVPTERREVTSAFRVSDISENYLLLDYAQIARGEEPFGEKYPVSGLFEALLREDYKGPVRVRYAFTLKEKMPLTLVMEKAELKSAEVNSHPVSFRPGNFDVNFVEAEIGEYVREGENEFVYSFDFYQHEGVHFALFDPMATESLRNCLYYDTSIEPIYLKGKFTVGKDFSLERRKGLLPPVTDKLSGCGYPFFKGALTLAGEVHYGGSGRALLELEGRFMTAEVYANGKRTDMVLDVKKDISSILRSGGNEVKIVLRSGLRNLFGPHHYKPDPEPMSVSPYNFEFRGEWKDGKPKDYTDEYHFVPFGVKKIFLNIEK